MTFKDVSQQAPGDTQAMTSANRLEDQIPDIHEEQPNAEALITRYFKCALTSTFILIGDIPGFQLMKFTFNGDFIAKGTNIDREGTIKLRNNPWTRLCRAYR